MAGNEGESRLWLIVKVALITAGSLYLVSLLIWFFQWATFFIYAALLAGVVGGAGYLAYRLAQANKQLAAPELPRERETVLTGLSTEMDDFDRRLLELETEEAQIDAKIRAR